MKVQVGLSEKEARRFFEKRHGFGRFKLDFKWLKDKRVWFWSPLVLCFILLAVVMIIVGENSRLVSEVKGFEQRETVEELRSFQSLSLEEGWSLFLKTLMFYFLKFLPLIFIIVGIAWLLHGVGFRII